MRRLPSAVLSMLILCSAQTTLAAGPELPGGHRATPPDPLDQAVKHTIMKASGQFQRCYLNYLKGGAAIKEGDLTVDWQLTPKGKPVKTAVVASSFSSATTKPSLEPCIVKQVAALEFPPTGKPENHYTFHKFRFKDVQQAAVVTP
jgi:hypothetical protein